MDETYGSIHRQSRPSPNNPKNCDYVNTDCESWYSFTLILCLVPFFLDFYLDFANDEHRLIPLENCQILNMKKMHST